MRWHIRGGLVVGALAALCACAVGGRSGERVRSTSAPVEAGACKDTFDFDDRRVIPTSGRPLDVAAFDVNGDGHDDIVALTASDSKALALEVLLDPVEGTWVVSPLPATAQGNDGDQRILPGDLDGDGRIDVVVSGYREGVRVAWNEGAGSFVDGDVPLPELLPPQSVADVDGDGRPDLLGSSTSALVIVRSAGGRLFDAPVEIAEAWPFRRPTAAADLDGDGVPDLVYGSDRIRVRRGLGGLGFASPTEYPCEEGLGHLAIGDVDGDGKPDVFSTGCSWWGYANVQQNLGGGALSSLETFFSSDNSPNSLALRDMNGDGRADVLKTTVDGEVRVFFGRSDGSLDEGPTIGGLGPMPAALDVDRDGRLDVVAITAGGVAVAYARPGGFGGSPVTYDLGPGGSYLNNKLADLDGDGVPELVRGRRALSGVTEVLRRGPTGAWEMAGTCTAPSLAGYAPYEASHFAIEDIDGDGLRDIVAIQTYSLVADDGGASAIVICRNRGDGTFEASRVGGDDSTGNLGGSSLTLADVDGDGDRDVLVGHNAGISVLTNDGAGSFAVPTTLTYLGDASLGIRTGDVDGDGKLDVVTVGKRLRLFRGGAPSVAETFEVEGDAVAAELADLDGDGRADLAALSTRGRVTVWLATSAGGFAPPVVLDGPPTTPNRRLGLALADVDRDGALDIVVAASTLDVHRNLGGRFAAPARFTRVECAAREVIAFHVVDVDADGFVDVLLDGCRVRGRAPCAVDPVPPDAGGAPDGSAESGATDAAVATDATGAADAAGPHDAAGSPPKDASASDAGSPRARRFGTGARARATASAPAPSAPQPGGDTPPPRTACSFGAAGAPRAPWIALGLAGLALLRRRTGAHRRPRDPQ